MEEKYKPEQCEREAVKCLTKQAFFKKKIRECRNKLGMLCNWQLLFKHMEKENGDLKALGIVKEKNIHLKITMYSEQ